MIKKIYINKKIEEKRTLIKKFINKIKIHLFLKKILLKTKINLLYKPGYLGCFDSSKLEDNKYIINIDVTLSKSKFIKVLLHEIGHLVDCLAGKNTPYSTTCTKLIEAMKIENQYVDNIDYSVEEFFAEAFMLYILKLKNSYNLIYTSSCIKDIIKEAENNI